MDIIVQLLASFITSAAFGIIFNVPGRMLLQCGAVGMIGWMAYLIGIQLHENAIASTLIAAFLVTVISRLFSKRYKKPIIIFNVPGIIPLVPGSLAYDAMRNIVEDNYMIAMQLGVKTMMISGAIAMGLVFSEVVNRIIQRSKRS